MIVVDASAILAVHFHEPERGDFVEKMLAAHSLVMTPVNLWEVLVRSYAADGEIGRAEAENLIDSFGIEIVPIDGALAQDAAAAFARFGRRTPAGLNLGDCVAYALAKTRNAPLLYKGDDFTRTDIVAA